MKRTEGYTADDGTWFATAAECKQHEELSDLKCLCDLTEADIIAATTRTNAPLADAFERIGNLITTQRRKSGDMKRAKKATQDDRHIETAKMIGVAE